MEDCILASFSTPLQFDDVHVQEACLAPLGGPLAVLTDSRLFIYTGAGKALKSWPLNCRICAGGMGWTDDLTLVCISHQDGAVWILDYYFTPPRRLKGFEAPIHRALVWQGGIIGLTTTLKLWHMDSTLFNLNELCARLPLISPPRTLSVCNMYISVDFPQVLIGLIEQSGHLQVSRNIVRALVPSFPSSPSLVIVAHPFRDVVATYTTDEHLLISSVDWSQVFHSVDLSSELGPDLTVRLPRVDWCLGSGLPTVALSWPKTPWAMQRRRQSQTAGLLIVSSAHTFRVALSSDFYACFAEVDGLRVLCATETRLIRERPAVLTQLTRPGSTTPGALIVEGLRALNSHDSSSHALLDAIPDKTSAAQELFLAFERELDLKQALEWLRAFALAGGSDVRSSGLVLRGLAGIRDCGCGVATIRQVRLTSLEVQLGRVSKTGGNLLLAKRLAKWWNLSSKPVLAIWAFANASTSVSNVEKLRARLLENGPTSGLAAAAAVMANRAGHKDLKLVAMELRIDRRVLALLAMGEPTKASDMIEGATGVDFDLQARLNSLKVLKPPPKRAGMEVIEMALGHLRSGDVDLCIAQLEDAANKTLEGKLAQQAKDHARLLKLQQSVSPRLVGKSLCETIVDCVARRQEDLVDGLKGGLSPLLYWHARLRGLSARGGWPEAHKLAMNKESSRYVSLTDVAETCIAQGALVYAAQVAFDMPMDDRRALILSRLNMFAEAVQAAKSSDSLAVIMSQCSDAKILDQARQKFSEVKKAGEASSLLLPSLESIRGVVAAPRRCDTQ